MGRPLLRVRRLPRADAARARLLAGRADRRVLARAARGRGGGDRRRALPRPPRAARADDGRLGRRRAARPRVVAGGGAGGLLRALDRDRARHGHRPLRARLRRARQVVPGRGRAAARDDRADARGGAVELHLPAARPGADRGPRVARRARHPRRDPRRGDRAAARARAAPRAGRPARRGARPGRRRGRPLDVVPAPRRRLLPRLGRGLRDDRAGDPVPARARPQRGVRRLRRRADGRGADPGAAACSASSRCGCRRCSR